MKMRWICQCNHDERIGCYIRSSLAQACKAMGADCHHHSADVGGWFCLLHNLYASCRTTADHRGGSLLILHGGAAETCINCPCDQYKDSPSDGGVFFSS